MNGIINVYKPVGITSFDVVRNIKKLSGCKKVGHTGTLDPLAYGVLPVCIGRATKIVDYIMKDFKVYKAVLKLGIVTDTYDREGKVLQDNDVNVTQEQILNAIESFIGEIKQVPPMYSALKVEGKRLYDLARMGIEVNRDSRTIKIYDINVEKIDIPDVEFTVKCSKGTYIRSLCYDIGSTLGCGGSMWDLERVQSGIFTTKNSVKLENLNADNIESFILPIEGALSNYDAIFIEKVYKKRLLNGVAITDKSLLDGIKENTPYRVYCDNNFIGLGIKSVNRFKMLKFLI